MVKKRTRKKKVERSVVGLDISYTSTGICVISESGKVAYDSVNIKADSKTLLNRMRRQEAILLAVMNKVYELKTSINAHIVCGWAIENYSFGSRQGREIAGELGGLIRHFITRKWYEDPKVVSIPVIEVAPTTLKKFITGTGKGEKAGVISHVASKTGFTFKNDDEADAYVLADLMSHYVGFKKPKYKYQEECLTTVRKDSDEQSQSKKRTRKKKQ